MNDRDEALTDLIESELGGEAGLVNVRGGRVVESARDLTGIALSGGGIRSATFNLGLLQGLQHFRLLDRVDFLSTVSGGGYIGGFWTAWRKRQADPPSEGELHPPRYDEANDLLENHDDAEDTPSFPAGTGSDGRAEPVEVRHLREFSNFLAPHLGLLNWDTGRIVVTLVSSVVPSLLTALAVIALAVLAWCGVAYGLFATSLGVSTAVYVGATALLLTAMEAVWRRRDEELDRWEFATAWTTGLGWAGLCWFFLHFGLWREAGSWYPAGQRLPLTEQGAGEWLLLLTPVVPLLLASFWLSAWRWIFSLSVRGHRDRVKRTSFDRVHARFLFAAAAWLALSLLWFGGTLLWGLAEGRVLGTATGLGGATAAVVLLFSRLQKRLGAEFKNRVGVGIMAMIRPMLPRLLAYLAIGMMVVGVIAALVGMSRLDPSFNAPLVVAVVSLLVLAGTVLLFNPNEIGLHTFYRARISRAYLGASNREAQADGRTEEREQDDMRLDEIRVRAPCHLICCAANDLSTRELANLHRGAVSAVLSPAGFSVGENARRWEDGDPATPTLSEAMTASAAAFNPLMGGKSKELGPAVTFLMAAFNLRLGLWVPRTATSRSSWERRLIGLPFLREMFGLAAARSADVHLSDGGHFENMAVYELIRRHCRFIVAADCGMDPDVAFDDFGNLVRRVRADFGVDIRIDLSPLRPDADGVSRQSMVAGDIHYPEGDTGVLLLVKPAITGGEPADVAQYRTRNRVFPHESTVDQFYDEAQWEAYRRLGEHIGHSAFRPICGDLDEADERYPRQVFQRARREWQPVPAGYDERLSHFADRVERLDSLLRQPECARLLREVYKEMDDLDHDRLVRVPAVVDEGGVRRAESTPASERLPDPADLAPSLHLIRRVLLLMQEAYTRESLEENHDHPLYLGLINYFARWTSAPLFRLWWPLLKTMYPQPFTRFVERRFGVRAGKTRGEPVFGSVGPIGEPVRGFAMSSWLQQNPDGLGEGDLVVPFRVELRYGDREFNVQAAQVVARLADDAIVWDATGFFVPPGLWGVGIGEQFLRRMLAAGLSVPAPAGAVASSGDAGENVPIERFYVRIRTVGSAGAAAKRRIATEMQLYRGAGFVPIPASVVPEPVRLRLATAEPSGSSARSRGAEQWMVAPPPSPEPPDTDPYATGAMSGARTESHG